jgi:hypothetical protein
MATGETTAIVLAMAEMPTPHTLTMGPARGEIMVTVQVMEETPTVAMLTMPLTGMTTAVSMTRTVQEMADEVMIMDREVATMGNLLRMAKPTVRWCRRH